jgi:hypothetical protein
MPAPRDDTSRQQPQPNGVAGDTVGGGQEVLGFPAEVAADEIVGRKVYPFSGHVFNLQTEDGWFYANGIVVHNCRCQLVPVAEGDLVEEE